MSNSNLISIIGWKIDGIQYNVGDSIQIEANVEVEAVWQDMNATVEGVEAIYTYTGLKITPEPVVYESGIRLTKDKDYI
jgi:hypothetical protein